jgi:hypothetical protein
MHTHKESSWALVWVPRTWIRLQIRGPAAHTDTPASTVVLTSDKISMTRNVATPDAEISAKTMSIAATQKVASAAKEGSATKTLTKDTTVTEIREATFTEKAITAAATLTGAAIVMETLEAENVGKTCWEPKLKTPAATLRAFSCYRELGLNSW